MKETFLKILPWIPIIGLYSDDRYGSVYSGFTPVIRKLWGTYQLGSLCFISYFVIKISL